MQGDCAYVGSVGEQVDPTPGTWRYMVPERSKVRKDNDII